MTSPTINILSLDGGGVCGIVFLHILKHIEQETGRPISSLFHIISGVSTGGIIALGLTKPQEEKKEPRYSAHDILTFYKEYSHLVFKKTWWGKVFDFLPMTRHCHTLFCSQYSTKGSADLYEKLFQDTVFSEALAHVLIPAYNINPFPGKEPRLKIFSSYKIKKSIEKECFAGDFFMKEIALSTSAAPLYFPPQKIHWVNRHKQQMLSPYCLIDGGVAMNNPSLLAYVHARALHPHAKIRIVSLGIQQNHSDYKEVVFSHSPGMLEWSRKIGKLIVYPQLSAYHMILKYEMRQKPDRLKYFRIHVPSSQLYSGFDDVSKKYIQFLDHLSCEILKKNQRKIKALIKIL
jgi:patatin-like phospholipase/acyl hydrolase